MKFTILQFDQNMQPMMLSEVDARDEAAAKAQAYRTYGNVPGLMVKKSEPAQQQQS